MKGMKITTAVDNRSAEERGQISMKYLHHYSSTTQKHLNQHVPVEGTYFPCELCHFLSIFTFDNQPWFHCRVPETTGKARRWMFSGDSRYAILDFRAKFLWLELRSSIVTRGTIEPSDWARTSESRSNPRWSSQLMTCSKTEAFSSAYRETWGGSWSSAVVRYFGCLEWCCQNMQVLAL